MQVDDTYKTEAYIQWEIKGKKKKQKLGNSQDIIRNKDFIYEIAGQKL